MTSDNRADINSIAALKKKLRGKLLLREDPGYKEASQAWNLHVEQLPSLIVSVESVEDIMTAVTFAQAKHVGVGVMATGHGVGTPCIDGLLINTSGMRGVTIDPISRVATVEAGALWKDVIGLAHAYGLAPLAGSAPHVGVIGYTVGGGFGYLGRKFGLNSASVISADVVTADGMLLHVNQNENPDLFWSVKGGGGNFGVIASLSFALYPIEDVFGGAVFYPIEEGHNVLTAFAEWTKTIPDEITAAFAFMNIPPLPTVPEVLKGRSVVVVKGCYCGQEPNDGEKLFAPMRALAKPIADSFRVMPVTSMDEISKDPVDPIGVLQYSGMLTDLSSQVIDTLVKIVGVGSGSGLVAVELRKLGGALSRQSTDIKLIDTRADFSINALGLTPTLAMGAKMQSDLSLLSDAMKPYLTGQVFLNFMEVDPPVERVRAAYAPEDWEKLVALKTKYDTQNIFRFNRNIPPIA